MSENTSTVNISFRKDLLNEIDRVAEAESRSRSELIREAARMYILRRKRWQMIFERADEAASQTGISREDVGEEIRRHRNEKKQAL